MNNKIPMLNPLVLELKNAGLVHDEHDRPALGLAPIRGQTIVVPLTQEIIDGLLNYLHKAKIELQTYEKKKK